MRRHLDKYLPFRLGYPLALWSAILLVAAGMLVAVYEEQLYRDFLIGNNWCRVLPITELTPDAFAHALSEIEPLQENPLDALAAKLKQRLPQLF